MQSALVQRGLYPAHIVIIQLLVILSHDPQGVYGFFLLLCSGRFERKSHIQYFRWIIAVLRESRDFYPQPPEDRSCTHVLPDDRAVLRFPDGAPEDNLRGLQQKIQPVGGDIVEFFNAEE